MLSFTQAAFSEDSKQIVNNIKGICVRKAPGNHIPNRLKRYHLLNITVGYNTKNINKSNLADTQVFKYMYF